MSDMPQDFEAMKSRLDEIADEVSVEGISLDDALALYEEAVKLGLAACDVSEADILVPEGAEEAEELEEGAEGTEVVAEGSVGAENVPEDAEAVADAIAVAEAVTAAEGGEGAAFEGEAPAASEENNL